jgi:nucleoside-diphosphate-sugar epimerase
MKILVTGAAGFLGSEVVRQALARGHAVRAMVRRESDRARFENRGNLKLETRNLELFIADLRQPDRFAQASAGLEAVVHCAAVTSEGAPDEALSYAVNLDGTRRLYLAARDAGVGRWIQISSMSAHPGIGSLYGRTKLAADDYLRGQTDRPAWTILRPSLIYGPDTRGLVAKTTRLLARLPVLPIVGSGRNLLRPVYVGDVAAAALDCLACEATIRRSYMLGGADEVTLNEFMSRLGHACGYPRRPLHLPIGLCYPIALILGKVLKKPPLTVDNVLGVKDLARVEHESAVRDWGYAPRTLEQGLRETFLAPAEQGTCEPASDLVKWGQARTSSAPRMDEPQDASAESGQPARHDPLS